MSVYLHQWHLTSVCCVSFCLDAIHERGSTLLPGPYCAVTSILRSIRPTAWRQGASMATADCTYDHHRETEGDASPMNGQIGVDGATQREMEFVLDRREAKYIVQVVEGCCQGDSNRKMSLLYWLILPSVHFSVMKTASNTLRVKGVKKTSAGFYRKTGMRMRSGGISCISVSLTVKSDIIREKQSPFHISHRLSLPVLSVNPHLSHSPSLSLSAHLWFSCSIMAHWETFIHPHPPLPLSPFLSTTLFSSSSSSTSSLPARLPRLSLSTSL